MGRAVVYSWRHSVTMECSGSGHPSRRPVGKNQRQQVLHRFQEMHSDAHR
jgi:hypothetical protein